MRGSRRGCSNLISSILLCSFFCHAVLFFVLFHPSVAGRLCRLIRLCRNGGHDAGDLGAMGSALLYILCLAARRAKTEHTQSSPLFCEEIGEVGMGFIYIVFHWSLYTTD